MGSSWKTSRSCYKAGNGAVPEWKGEGSHSLLRRFESARRLQSKFLRAQSFVRLLHDAEPVVRKGSKMDITHWRIGNIPGTSTGLPEGVMPGELPDGSRQVSLRANGYMDPGAPAGPYHLYTFELYALDTKLDVPQGTPQQAADTRMAVVNAMDGHVLGKAVLVARFHQ